MGMRLRALLGTAGIVLIALAGAYWFGRGSPAFPPREEPEAGVARSPRTSSVVDGGAVAPLQTIEAERRAADETLWAPEIRAQAHEGVFVRLWDALRGATNAWDVLGGFEFGEVQGPEAMTHRASSLGIVESRSAGGVRRWTLAEARRFMEGWRDEGWSLVQSEFRHRRYDEAPDGSRRSVFRVSLQGRRPEPAERATVTTELHVTWGQGVAAEGGYFPAVLRIEDLVVRRRGERGLFVRQVSRPVVPESGTPFVDPLIVYDVDGNGFPELILGSRNEIYRNQGNGRFERGRCVSGAPGPMLTSVVCDATGDGAVDFLAADHDGLWLWPGTGGGRWDGAPRRVWMADARLENPFVLAPGDVDGDGDVDLWLGQYKLPYVGGQMPTPYFDANDGFPGYLLIQDSEGRFRDATVEAGLASKRHRRTYSAVFGDLDEDGDVDLSLVSDFAGLDVFWNDGKGRFREKAEALRGSTRAFGMAQSLADFDGDGRLDVLMVGMNSYTGQRLEALGLRGALDAAHPGERAAMAHGNRLYAGRADGLEEVVLPPELVETGWSWGVTTADFDNDGLLDVHIVNGHKSRGTVLDYERQFWRHDLEIGRSDLDPARDLYFRATAGALYGAGWSYGGFEKNRLLLGQGEGRYYEAGWLLDVGFEDDFRNLVGADLDMDGRVDLVGTTYGNWPEGRQGWHVFRNELALDHHWVGFRLHTGGKGRTPIGARVGIRSDGRWQRRWIVAGDSYRSQHPAVAHFGLGPVGRVDVVEVRWPDGTVRRMEAPAVDRYHDVRPDEETPTGKAD